VNTRDSQFTRSEMKLRKSQGAKRSAEGTSQSESPGVKESARGVKKQEVEKEGG